MNDFLNKITCGDCLKLLPKLPANSIDAIVTDPPAGIAFMGKEWDDFSLVKNTKSQVKELMNSGVAFSNNELMEFQDFICNVFVEVDRVLKYGGYALVWALPRTSHHTAMGLERAGFEIRDIITHIFLSGFPKSINVGKKIDDLLGNERETVYDDGRKKRLKNQTDKYDSPMGLKTVNRNPNLSKGYSEWEGFGNSLKPASEHWILCRKPLSEKTIAKNIMKWGVGALNIPECRIPINPAIDDMLRKTNRKERISKVWKEGSGFENEKNNITGVRPEGRFPSNITIECTCQSEQHTEDCPCYMLDKQSGETSRGHWTNSKITGFGKFGGGKQEYFGKGEYDTDTGGASRFFYCAKASRKDRNRFNSHPTVKPIRLCEYLVKLVSKKGQIVLDPFAGSASVLVACKKLQRQFIGFEKEQTYVNIAEKRLRIAAVQLTVF